MVSIMQPKEEKLSCLPYLALCHHRIIGGFRKVLTTKIHYTVWVDILRKHYFIQIETQWSFPLMDQKFSEFRESDKSLKHELGSI